MAGRVAKDGITVNCVSPGFVPETDFWQPRIKKDPAVYDDRSLRYRWVARGRHQRWPSGRVPAEPERRLDQLVRSLVSTEETSSGVSPVRNSLGGAGIP